MSAPKNRYLVHESHDDDTTMHLVAPIDDVERTLCGKAWVARFLNRDAPMCEECERVAWSAPEFVEETTTPQ